MTDYKKKKYRLVVSDQIKSDVYVSMIKKQRKNGGKLINEALSPEGHTPSKRIKTNNGVKNKKND